MPAARRQPPLGSLWEVSALATLADRAAARLSSVGRPPAAASDRFQQRPSASHNAPRAKTRPVKRHNAHRSAKSANTMSSKSAFQQKLANFKNRFQTMLGAKAQASYAQLGRRSLARAVTPPTPLLARRVTMN